MKKVTTALATGLLIATMSTPTLAVTPGYKPVSQQAWYINLQKAVDNTDPKKNPAMQDLIDKAVAEIMKNYNATH